MSTFCCKGIYSEDAVFLGSKRLLSKKSKKAARYWRDVGLSIKVPKEAKEGNYVDKKCPFTGPGSLLRSCFIDVGSSPSVLRNVSIRGALLKGMCISTKMKCGPFRCLRMYVAISSCRQANDHHPTQLPPLH